jgi:chromosome segregation ATPase
MGDEEPTRRFDEQPEWAKELRAEVMRLHERFDARDRQTKPLHETLEAIRVELRELREGQAKLSEGQAKLSEGQAKLSEEQARLSEEQARLSEEQARLSAGQRALQESQEALREEIRLEFRRLNAKVFDVLQRYLDHAADLSELNRRVVALENAKISSDSPS